MRDIGGGIYVWGAERSAERFASLDEELVSLQNVDLETAATSDIRRALNAFGAGYATRRMWSIPTTAFRCGRRTDPESLWNNSTELWAPPAAHTPRGRFNKARQPALYYSGDPLTCLLEVRPDPLEYRTILVMRPRDDRRIMSVQLGLERLPQAPAYIRAFGTMLQGLSEEPNFVEYLERRRIRQRWSVQNTYFTEVCSRLYLADESSSYRLTNLIGEQLMKVPSVTSITFPSVANNYHGTNVAMPVRYAAASLRPVEAWLVALGERTDPLSVQQTARVIRRATIGDDGRLAWGGLTSSSLHDLHLEVAPIRDPPRPRHQGGGLMGRLMNLFRRS